MSLSFEKRSLFDIILKQIVLNKNLTDFIAFNPIKLSINYQKCKLTLFSLILKNLKIF